MKRQPPTDPTSQTEYKNFTDGLKRLLSVPKAEIDKREKAWKETEHKRGRPKKDSKA